MEDDSAKTDPAERPNGVKENAPQSAKILPFRRPIPQPEFDLDWFYEDEEFFTQYMDDFD